MVQRWWLARFSLVLRDMEDRHNVSEQRYAEWALDIWVEVPIFRWRRETLLPIVVDEPAEYPKHDEDDLSTEALLSEQERHENALSSAPPLQKAILFCSLPGQVRYLKWWLTKYFADYVHIFHMYAEMGHNGCTEMQLKFQDASNPSVSITTPKLDWIGLNPNAANHAVLTQKFWVLNKQWQAFPQVDRLGQNRVPHTL